MKHNALTKLFAIGTAMATLYGCTGDPAFSVSDLQLGTGIGNTFSEGTVAIDTSGANPVITVHLADKNGLLSSEPVAVTFSSPCTATGDATITPSTVTNSSGVITATYNNISCAATDDILAATDTTPPLTATGQLTPPATPAGPTGTEVAVGGIGSGGFVSGTLFVASSTIPTGGNTLITVDVVDSTGSPTSEPMDIVFTSGCVNFGLATLSNTNVSTTTGTASTLFTDLDTGCSADNVRATATLTNVGTTATLNPNTAVGNIQISATAPPPAGSLNLGSGLGGGFSKGNLNIQSTSIAPGGSTQITANIVDENDQFDTASHTVNFFYYCNNLGTGNLSSTAVTSSNGIFTTTFTDVSCGGAVDILATATLNAATHTATGTLSVDGAAPPPAGSILNLGSGLGGGFTQGSLNIQSTSIAPTGSTQITANIVDDTNLFSTASHTVNFFYNCSNLGTGNLSSTAVTSSTGIFTTTFTDVSCDGTVDILATSTLNGATHTANGSLTVNDTTIQIEQVGRDIGASFVIDEIGIGGDTQNTGALNAGETITLSVTIVDGSGNLLTNTTTVDFTSTCFSTGLADIYDAPGGSNSVTTTSGRATVTYQAQGCSGADNITATARSGSIIIGTATGSINVTPANVNSIQFVTADPNQIAIRGMSSSGVGETTTVSFKVQDTTGGAIPNHPVTFTLSNTDGGIEFGDTGTATTSSTSDGSGNVSVVVKSGTTKASFRVLVTSDVDTAIVGQSDPILISTGIADQNSMTISASIVNVEALNFSGEVSVITAYASDRYNNPVPDNTVIGFIAEAGSIQSSCLTTNGTCSVNWTSQFPHPDTSFLNATAQDAGLATILGFVVGEESFTDANGNGQYDSGEPFDDTPEAFLDVDNNGTRGDGTGGTPVEIYLDYNNSNTYNGVNTTFNGVLCNSNCGTQSGIHARDSATIVMSGSSANITITPLSKLNWGYGCNISFTYTVADVNGNGMPADSDIDVSSTSGSILTGSSRTIADGSSGAAIYTGTLKTGTADSTGNFFTVKVTTPNGLISERNSEIFEVLSTNNCTP